MPEMADRHESLDWAERWLSDAFRVIDLPGGCGLVEIDMSRSRALLERLRAAGVPSTYNHMVVRAAALTLVRHPQLHVMVAGTRRLRPERVDVGLSVAGSSFYAPVMVLEDAARKKLPELSAEIVRRAPEIREKEQRDLSFMRKLGWLIPFGWLRRAILRWLFQRTAFRRQLVGTLQISAVNALDVTMLLTTTAAASIGVAAVRDRVIAVDGKPEVRPTMMLACSMDHKAWDGVAVATFQSEVRKILESGELEGDCELP
jgi:pyruvate/2-oxoglutarate dehydrogenase complex dihydrolipoamide acyltransferase (E2) component